MKDIVIYLLEVSLCLSIFVLIYRIFLRATTFFKFNRGYLLTGLIASFVIPSVQFYYDVYIQATATPIHTTGIDIPHMETTWPEINIWNVALLIYITGIISIMLRNIIAYRKLHRIIKSGIHIKTPQFTIIDSKEANSPFSIFNYIVINCDNISDIEKDLIIKHEATHIRQKHWLDLFCSECALLLQWFNPLMWLYVHTQKENHEFLADKSVIDTGCTPAVYQAVLINQRFQGPVFSFSNSFNYSNHLKRLTMIKKVKSSPWKRISALILVPIFGLFFWVSAKPNYITLPITENNISENRIEADKKDSIKVTGYKLIEDSNGNLSENNQKTFFVIESNEYAPDSQKAIQQHNKKGISETVITKTSESITSTGPNEFPKDKQPLFIIDGEEAPYGIDHLSPNEIEAISVLKDKSATELYGEKGKNGVIIIKLIKPQNVADNSTTYKGKVMTAGTTEGIAMAAVIIKGTTIGTITNTNGSYEIKAPENSTLVFSIPGYKKQEIKATNLTNDVFLETE